MLSTWIEVAADRLALVPSRDAQKTAEAALRMEYLSGSSKPKPRSVTRLDMVQI